MRRGRDRGLLGLPGAFGARALARKPGSLRIFEERVRRDPGFAARAGKAPKQRKGLQTFLGVGFASSWLALLGAIHEQRAAQGSPWFWAWLIGLATAGGATLGLMLLRRWFEPRLPELEELDRWSYLAALHAFPWLTIHLVSGSLWAYDSWGSYWDWQPGARPGLRGLALSGWAAASGAGQGPGLGGGCRGVSLRGCSVRGRLRTWVLARSMVM